MADSELPEIPAKKSKGNQSGGGGGSTGPSSTGVKPLPDGSVDWLLLALQQNGEDFDIPVFEEEAERELSDAEIEHFGLPEGTNFSIESIFGYDVTRDYIGDPTVGEDTKLSDEEGSEAIDRHVTVSLGHRVNGYHEEEITDTFGEDTYIRVGMGYKDLYDSPRDRARHVRFKTTTSKKKGRRRKARAKWNAAEVDFGKADYEAYCEEIGVDPYPGRNNGDDEE